MADLSLDASTPTPPAWEMPTTRLASILGEALWPSQQSLAATLGAPVDGAAWIAHKMGVPVPGDMREADPTVQANTGRSLKDAVAAATTAQALAAVHPSKGW